MTLDLLYRGPLASCDYGCTYCPFAKQHDTPAELAADRAALERLARWIRARDATPLGLFVTPWGEALVHAYYRDTLAALTHLPHVRRVAVQTNLSTPVDWIHRARPDRLGIWATYHPDWTDLDGFVARIETLRAHGVRVSAGAVGFARLADDIDRLREALPDDVYLWINAPKSSEPTTPATRARFTAIDPLFPLNAVYHDSQGRPCRTGHTTIAVDGDGTVRRCHFVATPLGNLYDTPLESLLAPGPTPCPNATCGCHIGYVHLEPLGLDRVFGEGILERVPTRVPTSTVRTGAADR